MVQVRMAPGSMTLTCSQLGLVVGVCELRALLPLHLVTIPMHHILAHAIKSSEQQLILSTV